MNRKISLIAIVLILIGVGYFLIKGRGAEEISNAQTDITETNQAVPDKSVQSGNDEVYIPSSFGKGTGLYTASIKVPNSNTIISFKLVNAEIKLRNPDFNVFVDSKTAGTVSGQNLGNATFRADGKYTAFQTMSTCGAGCFSFSLYAIDLNTPKVINIPFPKKTTDYTGDLTQYQNKVAQPFIDSYIFAGDKLRIEFFFVATNKNDGKTYKISPKEIWDYNPLTNTYSLVSTSS